MARETEGLAESAGTGALGTVEAGALGTGDYCCVDCGYGIVTFGVVPTCPMCNAARWERRRSTPFRGGIREGPPAETSHYATAPVDASESTSSS